MKDVEGVIILTLIAVGAVVVAIYLVLDHLVPHNAVSSTRTTDVAKASVAFTGIVGAALTGVYAFRKQKLAEADAARADADHLLSRFGRASDQMGHESPAVRLAGVYAMAALADEWDQRQLCINVLTAYMQLPYTPVESDSGYRAGEREVRHNLLRVIRDRLREGASHSWQGLNFRFEGAVFDGGDLNKARFTGGHVSFHRARFVGATFHFNDVVIDGASVWFTKSRFESGTFDLSNLTLKSGKVVFTDASVIGATIKSEGFRAQGGKLPPRRGRRAERRPHVIAARSAAGRRTRRCLETCRPDGPRGPYPHRAFELTLGPAGRRSHPRLRGRRGCRDFGVAVQSSSTQRDSSPVAAT